MVALVLACLTLMTLDHHPGAGLARSSRPARAMGSVFGPVESGTSPVVRPVTAVGDWFRTRRSPCSTTSPPSQAQNSRLRAQQSTVAATHRNQLAEYQGLTSAADTLGQALVPAHVVGLRPGPVLLAHGDHRRRLRTPACSPTRRCSTTTGSSAGCSG